MPVGEPRRKHRPEEKSRADGYATPPPQWFARRYGRPTSQTYHPRNRIQKSTLRHKAGPAGGRVIIVILKQVPEGCEDLFVAVTVSMPDDFHTRAIGIDPPGKPGYPYMAIIALLPCKCGGIKIPAYLGATFIVIKATHIKCFAIPIGNFGPTIPLIKVELTIGPPITEWVEWS